MSLSSVASEDKKVGKDGRLYPAKRITLGVEKKLNEASYKGNIGVMELAKFHSTASKEDKDKFAELMKKKKEAANEHQEKQMSSQIWDHVQKVTGTKLHQMENTMVPFSTMLESKEDFILQTLADRDINASIKDGKVHIHDHTQHKKAQGIVKRLGMPHQVVKAAIKEETTEESTAQTVLEAMQTHEFNKLVRGYLAHKKAAKIGNFKPMTIDQYKRTSVKALSTAPIKEDLDEAYIPTQGSEAAKLSATQITQMQQRIKKLQQKPNTLHNALAIKATKQQLVAKIKQHKEKHDKHQVSEENLEELSKETLTSYAKKAVGNTKPNREWQRLSGLIRAQMKVNKKADKKPVSEDAGADEVDEIEMDVPLLTRVFEYARENVKDDAQLHVLITAIIKASKEKDTLTMDDYKRIINDKKAEMTEEKKLVVPSLKPRDPNHAVLMAKKVASGAHKNKRKDMMSGKTKHKGKMDEELNIKTE